jgi:hypothetical protein
MRNGPFFVVVGFLNATRLTAYVTATATYTTSLYE